MSNEDIPSGSLKLCKDCKWVSGALLDSIAGCEAPQNKSMEISYITGEWLYEFPLAVEARRVYSKQACTPDAAWFQPKPTLAQRILAEAQPRTQVKPANKIGIEDL